MTTFTTPLHPALLAALPVGMVDAVRPAIPLPAPGVARGVAPVATPAPAPSTATSHATSHATNDRVAGLTDALAEARHAYDAAGEIVALRQATLAEAHTVIAQRRAAFAETTAQAAHLADEAIRSGHDTTRQKRAHDKATLAAFRAQQDISAAEATISALAADVATAIAAQGVEGDRLATLDAALFGAQAEATRDALDTEWVALIQATLDLAKRSRAANAAAAAQRGAGQRGRGAVDRYLVLPGHPSRHNPLMTNDAKQAARQGATLHLAADLCRFDASEHSVTAGM